MKLNFILRALCSEDFSFSLPRLSLELTIGWVNHGLNHSKQTWVGDGHTQITYGIIGLKTNFTHGLTGPHQMDVRLALIITRI